MVVALETVQELVAKRERAIVVDDTWPLLLADVDFARRVTGSIRRA